MTIIYILALLSICMENPSAYLIYIFIVIHKFYKWFPYVFIPLLMIWIHKF